MVLILVLLDYWFLTDKGVAAWQQMKSLNPCFAGLLVSDRCYYKPFAISSLLSRIHVNYNNPVKKDAVF